MPVPMEKQIISQAARQLLKFGVGGGAYTLLEKAWRGYSHPSMFAAGGLCFLGLGTLSRHSGPFVAKCVAGGGLITAVELMTGCVVNLWLGKKVWDYRDERYHILGQACPRFFLLWCALSGLVLLSYPHLGNFEKGITGRISRRSAEKCANSQRYVEF